MGKKKDENGSYSKNITLSYELLKNRVKFFNNPSFRTCFQEYLLNTYNIQCQIRLLETQEIYLTLIGDKPNVKTAREAIPQLFESTQEKIYDNENTDKQSIYFKFKPFFCCFIEILLCSDLLVTTDSIRLNYLYFTTNNGSTEDFYIMGKNSYVSWILQSSLFYT